MPRVFLCHSSSDKPKVEELATKLMNVGIDVWYDKWEIRIGDSIAGKVADGIQRSDFLVVVLSKNSVRSKWVSRELDTALSIELEKKGAFILPLLLSMCTIPVLLRGKRYANFEESPEEAVEELVEAIVRKQPMLTLAPRATGQHRTSLQRKVMALTLISSEWGSDHTMYAEEPELGFDNLSKKTDTMLGTICAFLIKNRYAQPLEFRKEKRTFLQKIGFSCGNIRAMIHRSQDDWQSWESEVFAELNYADNPVTAEKIIKGLLVAEELGWKGIKYTLRARLDISNVYAGLEKEGFSIDRYLPPPNPQVDMRLKSWQMQECAWSNDKTIVPTFHLKQTTANVMQIEIKWSQFLEAAVWPEKNPWKTLAPEVLLPRLVNVIS